MLSTYVRKLFIGTVAATVIAGVACSATPTKRTGTGGAGSTGAAGTTATAGTTGAAGATDTAGSTGAAGSTDTAGTTGAAGSTDTGGTTGAAGTMAAAGTTGAAGSTGTGGTTGAAGTTQPPVDNVPISALPVAVTDHWYASGWAADDYTMGMFATGIPWTITDQTGSATGPCSSRVAGALGHCFKVTYAPLTNPDGVTPTHASIAFLGALAGGAPNFTDATMAPRVAQGAKRLAGAVTGAVGGEAVLFNLGSNSDPASYQFTTLALTTAWQKIEITLEGVTYDHFLSPFGFGTTSTTPITFYYDDLRFDTTPVTQP